MSEILESSRGEWRVKAALGLEAQCFGESGWGLRWRGQGNWVVAYGAASGRRGGGPGVSPGPAAGVCRRGSAQGHLVHALPRPVGQRIGGWRREAASARGGGARRAGRGGAAATGQGDKVEGWGLGEAQNCSVSCWVAPLMEHWRSFVPCRLAVLSTVFFNRLSNQELVNDGT